MTERDIAFPLFLAVWNHVQKQRTPAVHLRMAHWLMARWQGGDTRLLLMAFRSCGKSTIVGLFAAWLLWRNPDLRIVVLAADTTLAAKMVRNTRRIIEKHPLTKALRPEKPDQWASDRFTIKRKSELRDPSMLAFGISANITGSRADVIICDDVEVPNTCDTFEKRESLKERLSELSFVLVPHGLQLFVGTPHAYETIYDLEYLEGYKDLRIPLLNAGGASAWPERFGAADIERLKRAGGPRRFASQMMLQAVPVTDSRLDVQALQWYADDITYSEAQARPQLHIGETRLAHCSAWWDPAFGRGGDGSVVAIIYGDAAGGYWLHRLLYVTVDPRLPDDEATQQCRIVSALCRQFYVPSLTVETNGIGRFLPAILRREARGAFAVVEVANRRPKGLRILEAFDAVLAAKALRVNASIKATAFLEEMRDWKPGNHSRDDGLDAVAGALSQSPVRIGALPKGAKRPEVWAGSAWHLAKTDFNVME
jgi:hypothetical protein